MDLQYTYIIDGNNQSTKDKLINLLKKQDILSIVIFGVGSIAESSVIAADTVANEVISGFSRRVFWIKDPALIPFLKTLIKNSATYSIEDINTSSAIGISLSNDHEIKDIIPISEASDSLRMEIAFNNAGN